MLRTSPAQPFRLRSFRSGGSQEAERGRTCVRPLLGSGSVAPSGPTALSARGSHEVSRDGPSGGDGECDVVVGTYEMALHRAAMLSESSVLRPTSIPVRPRQKRCLVTPPFMVEPAGFEPASDKIIHFTFIAIAGLHRRFRSSQTDTSLSIRLCAFRPGVVARTFSQSGRKDRPFEGISRGSA